MPIQRINKRTPVPKSTDGQRPVYAEDVNKIIDKVNELENEVENISIEESATTGITAHAGGGQANATQLDYGYSKVTTVDTNNDSVKLPRALVGKHCVIIDAYTSTQLAVFPLSGDNFEGLTANTKVDLFGGSSMECICFVDGEWTLI